MSKLPCGKALLYLAIVQCRIDFEQPSLIEFLQVLTTYFPFISLDSPYTHVHDELDKLPNLPTSVVRGTYNKPALARFLKEAGLVTLHEVFDNPKFQDLLYDADLRMKIEGMAIAGFRPLEIELEVKQTIQDIDINMVKTYLDCFVNYRDMNFIDKRNFIHSAFEEPKERLLLIRCLETKSKDWVRTYLSLSTKTYNHIEMVNSRAHLVTLKTQEALLAGDDMKLMSLVKIGLNIADSLHKFGVGNQDAAEQLLAALSKKPEDVGVVTPKPMTVEQLEDIYLEQTRPPQS